MRSEETDGQNFKRAFSFKCSPSEFMTVSRIKVSLSTSKIPMRWVNGQSLGPRDTLTLASDRLRHNEKITQRLHYGLGRSADGPRLTHTNVPKQNHARSTLALGEIPDSAGLRGARFASVCLGFVVLTESGRILAIAIARRVAHAKTVP